MKDFRKYYAYSVDPPVEIVANFYRGPLPDREIFGRFQKHNIQTVITLCDENYASLDTRAQCKQRNLTHIHIPLSPFRRPTTKEIRHFLELVEDRHHAPIYTHCIHGKDRTGAMIALFRLSQGWSLDDAVSEMHEYRFGTEFEELMQTVHEFRL